MKCGKIKPKIGAYRQYRAKMKCGKIKPKIGAYGQYKRINIEMQERPLGLFCLVFSIPRHATR